ncbi:hypothetical protein MLD52_10905 [Puniceicoccaceae bacterium K14]|nr:hypothetical protein [Puniceicoccaceae bacterium K14]
MRKHFAILLAQVLVYVLMVIFIFANAEYQFIGLYLKADSEYAKSTAYLGACLIALVGTISIWLTWYYINKSNSMRDMLVICAWTHRVKTHGKWVSLEDFFTEQLGYVISHGLSDKKLAELRQEVDTDFPKLKLDTKKREM